MTFRRTKIVATLGPASNSPEVLEQLIIAGLDVARLNFSHGTPDDHKARAALVRELAAKHGRHVALLGDLQGPKIRIAKFENKRIELKEGDLFRLSSSHSRTAGTQEVVGIDSVSYTHLDVYKRQDRLADLPDELQPPLFRGHAQLFRQHPDSAGGEWPGDRGAGTR